MLKSVKITGSKPPAEPLLIYPAAQEEALGLYRQYLPPGKLFVKVNIQLVAFMLLLKSLPSNMVICHPEDTNYHQRV